MAPRLRYTPAPRKEDRNATDRPRRRGRPDFHRTRPAGVAADARVHVLVEVLDATDLPMAAMAAAGKGFDWLADEPELYPTPTWWSAPARWSRTAASSSPASRSPTFPATSAGPPSSSRATTTAAPTSSWPSSRQFRARDLTWFCRSQPSQEPGARSRRWCASTSSRRSIGLSSPANSAMHPADWLAANGATFFTVFGFGQPSPGCHRPGAAVRGMGVAPSGGTHA